MMAARQADETAEQFSARLSELVIGGIVSLSVGLGMKTGLFDVLIEHGETPKTSGELADLAGLKERYVREWLGAMTCAHIVELDPATGKYHLPSHRADRFRPGTSSGAMALFSKSVAYIGERFHTVADCMQKEGPLGYTSNVSKSFEETQDEFTALWFKGHLVQDFISSVPELQAKLDRGIRVLDIGCWRGMATRILAQRFPNSQFMGIDNDQAQIDIAHGMASSEKMTNLDYVCMDATAMPSNWAGSIDYVLCRDVLHDAPRPDLIVDEVKRVLKKDGSMSVIEYDVDSSHAKNIDRRLSAFRYTYSLFHCLPMSCGDGMGLMWGVDRVIKFLNDKGFEVTTSPIKGGDQMHFFCKMPVKSASSEF